ILLQREPSPALQRTSDSGPNDKAGSSPRQSSARYASGPTGCHAAAEQAPAGTAGPGRRSPPRTRRRAHLVQVSTGASPDRCSKAAATRGNAARVYHIMQRGPPALKARAVRCALWSRAEQRGAMMDT
ncbi:unnamed protein product, partial [Prorocentrum cordatum]